MANIINFFNYDFDIYQFYAECFMIEHKYNYLFSLTSSNIEDTSLILISKNNIEFIDLTQNVVTLNNIPDSTIFLIAITKFQGIKPTININFDFNVNILKLFSIPTQYSETYEIKSLNKFIEKYKINTFTFIKNDDIFILNLLFSLLHFKNNDLFKLINDTSFI